MQHWNRLICKSKEQELIADKTSYARRKQGVKIEKTKKFIRIKPTRTEDEIKKIIEERNLAIKKRHSEAYKLRRENKNNK